MTVSGSLRDVLADVLDLTSEVVVAAAVLAARRVDFPESTALSWHEPDEDDTPG
ncbi:hypothetical protein [Actinomycetospora sp. CA-053990]|uniref:hypothetical protein n=1 Tax=Actinomycetospora sp. CA-053990 TaxID=3239891 RepID=UPI003D8CE7EC